MIRYDGDELVAVQDGQRVGYCRWHKLLDGWSWIDELVVRADKRRQGIGRALLYAVPAPIRLKAPQAGEFFLGAGMRRVAPTIYEMRLLSILCAGNNPQLVEVARQSGMAYGFRHDHKGYGWPFMVDVEWEAVKRDPGEWKRYLRVVVAQRPVMAMVPDYESPDQRGSMLRRARVLRRLGVLRVMVCPKFDGAVGHVPDWCVVAISVPSRYSGFLPDLYELKGRQVHLLGGTPGDQRELIPKITGHGGTVISVDGSAHTSAALWGSIYSEGRWLRRDGEPIGDYFALCRASGVAVVRELNAAAGFAQLPLL